MLIHYYNVIERASNPDVPIGSWYKHYPM